MDEVKFSPMQSRILEALEGKMTIKELTKAVYGRKKKPLNPTVVVTAAISQINTKCRYWDLRWKIGGEGMGRDGKTVWFEKR